MALIPPQTLDAARNASARSLPDRCAIISPSYDEVHQVYTSPYTLVLSGFPPALRYPGYIGSGIPVDVWDTSAEADYDLITYAQQMNVSYAQYRILTLPYALLLALSGPPPYIFRRDSQVVVGGSLSGVSWVGGTVYQVVDYTKDDSQPVEITAHCRKLTL